MVKSIQKVLGDFVQIGIVVKDLDRTIGVLSQVFGLGPFRSITYPPLGRDDIERWYHGMPGDFTIREAFAELGPIELELIQPLEGDSIWTDFLREHGEGIHHIRFNVRDLDRALEGVRNHGISPSQSGSGLRPGTTWAYLDTQETMGFVVELMNVLPGTDGRTPQFSNDQESPESFDVNEDAGDSQPRVTG